LRISWHSPLPPKLLGVNNDAILAGMQPPLGAFPTRNVGG
jgi:hypothetical protein